ncbi:MAG: histidine kinase dimerization/phospho-acceptor domain-containing protein [Gemmatimonadota bacterium]
MHTTWQATLFRWLLAGALVVSVGVAILASIGVARDLLGPLSWLLVATVLASGVAAWSHQRATERIRRSLAVGLTHHLRTSLSHVQTFNEMLLVHGGVSSEAQRREWLEVVGREAQRLGSAVENLLFLMQDGRRREFPVRRALDLGGLLEDVACDHAPPSERHLTMEVSPPPGIYVEADAAALRHALGNLIDGATRSAREGSTISATAAASGAVASVVVLYDPAEPDPAARNGRWSLLDSRALEGSTGDGFGLELAVVRHVARLHGGRAARFHNLDRDGFRVELPLARA